jgi:hypothetical protein
MSNQAGQYPCHSAVVAYFTSGGTQMGRALPGGGGGRAGRPLPPSADCAPPDPARVGAGGIAGTSGDGFRATSPGAVPAAARDIPVAPHHPSHPAAARVCVAASTSAECLPGALGVGGGRTLRAYPERCEGHSRQGEPGHTAYHPPAASSLAPLPMDGLRWAHPHALSGVQPHRLAESVEKVFSYLLYWPIFLQKYERPRDFFNTLARTKWCILRRGYSLPTIERPGHEE